VFSRRKKLKIALALLLVLIALTYAHKRYWDARYFDGYDASAALDVQTRNIEEIEDEGGSYRLLDFTFRGGDGDIVPALISLPLKTDDVPLPAVIFLHGIGQDKTAMRKYLQPFNRAGFAFLSFDQFLRGERELPEEASFWTEAQGFKRRPAKTVNDARRLVDYLVTSEAIDAERIYLVGASYGAITGATVLAQDKRLRAGVLVYGGGDLGLLLNSTALRAAVAVELGLVEGNKADPGDGPLPQLSAADATIAGGVIRVLTPLARYYMGAADPLHYAAGISPTPVYFQNGAHDVLIPKASAEALQDAVVEPKKITWYDSDHVGLDDAQTDRVLEDAVAWLLEQDAAFRAESRETAPE